MPAISSKKPSRIGRSRTGLAFSPPNQSRRAPKSSVISGHCWIQKKKDDAVENKYLFELNGRWTIDGSVRGERRPLYQSRLQAERESDVRPRKRKVFIRAIKNIEPGEEITTITVPITSRPI